MTIEPTENHQLMLPPSTGAFETDLEQKEEVTLYGQIHIINDLGVKVHVSLKFKLKEGGFHLKIIDPNTDEVLIEKKVDMKSNYNLSDLMEDTETIQEIQSYPKRLGRLQNKV